MTEEKKLYSTQEAAQALGMSDSNLRNLIRNGRAKPVRKFGDTWMFDEQEIERLRTRKTRPGPPKTK